MLWFHSRPWYDQSRDVCYSQVIVILTQISSAFVIIVSQSDTKFTLRWRHNGHDSVSNHRRLECLSSPLFTRRSKKTSKLRVTGLCAGNSPGTGEFPSQRASTAENVSIWWRHHEMVVLLKRALWVAEDVIVSSGAIRTLTHLPWTKWPSFRRRYFQMHFREWKVSYFD